MKYYETTITIHILSENTPVGQDLSLSDIDTAITDGACVGQCEIADEKELTGPEVAQRLREFGGEPDFFMLNDDGLSTE